MTANMIADDQKGGQGRELYRKKMKERKVAVKLAKDHKRPAEAHGVSFPVSSPPADMYVAHLDAVSSSAIPSSSLLPGNSTLANTSPQQRSPHMTPEGSQPTRVSQGATGYEMLEQRLAEASSALAEKRIQVKTQAEELALLKLQAKRDGATVDVLVAEKNDLIGQVSELRNQLLAVKGELTTQADQLDKLKLKEQADSKSPGPDLSPTRHQSLSESQQSEELNNLKDELYAANQRLAEQSMINDELQSKLKQQAAHLQLIDRGNSLPGELEKAHTSLKALQKDHRELCVRLSANEEELLLAKSKEKALSDQLSQAANTIALLKAELEEEKRGRALDIAGSTEQIKTLQSKLIGTSQNKQQNSPPHNLVLTANHSREVPEDPGQSESLTRHRSEPSGQLEALHRKVWSLQSQVADKESLLAAVQATADSLSQTSLENKELKTERDLLQERLVHVINDHVAVTMQLQAAQHAANQWQAKALSQSDGQLDNSPSNMAELLRRAEGRQMSLANQLLTVQEERTNLKVRNGQLEETIKVLQQAAASSLPNTAAPVSPQDGTSRLAEGLGQDGNDIQALRKERDTLIGQLKEEKSLVEQLAEEAENIPNLIGAAKQQRLMARAELAAQAKQLAQLQAENQNLRQLLTATAPSPGMSTTTEAPAGASLVTRSGQPAGPTGMDEGRGKTDAHIRENETGERANESKIDTQAVEKETGTQENLFDGPACAHCSEYDILV